MRTGRQGEKGEQKKMKITVAYEYFDDNLKNILKN